MIVPMKKVYIAARVADRDALIDALGELGVVHVMPVEPTRAVADEATADAMEQLRTALARLTGVTAAGEKPEMTALEAAREVNQIIRGNAEKSNRLTVLHQQADKLALWGDVRLEQFKQLAEAGVQVSFYMVPNEQVGAIEADCVEQVGQIDKKQVLVAVVTRDGEPTVPDKVKPVELPSRDRPDILAEAAQIDAELKADQRRLAQLAHLAPAMQRELTGLEEKAKITIATRSGLEHEKLYAVQGWVPADMDSTLQDGLSEKGIEAAVEMIKPVEEDEPPTLIKYPKWAQPIEGLFNILGTVAGYKEFDVAIPFMIALPIFAAILIGDGGYGALLFFGLLLGYKKLAPKLGEQFIKLLIIVGGVSLIWGFICSSFFGFQFYKPLIPVNMTDESRFLMMNISFTMGAIHLSIAQLWNAFTVFPNIKFLNKVGWAIFIWGMLGVVKMFVLGSPLGMDTPWPYFLLVGAILAILFACPSRNPAKMLAVGIANFPLSMLGAFSDVISYVRLMAVGLASGVLATSFNELALESSSIFITIPVLVFGHGLNLGLAMIALFAHGVRLNMLEFSNNLGMQWTGYVYSPLNKRSFS